MKALAYVVNLTRFAFRANPLFHLSIAISLVSVAIELLAMSSLLPLFTLVSGAQPRSDDIVSTGLHWIGLPVTADVLVWTFLVLFTARIASQLAGQTLSMYLGRRVMAQLGATAFDQITRTLTLSEIGQKSIGFYIGLAGDEAFRASVVVISLTQFVSTLALSLLYFAAIANYSPATAIVLLLFLLLSATILAWVIRASHRMGARQVAESRRASSVFLDTLNNLKAVRAFSAESYAVSLYRNLIFGYTKVWFWIDELSLLSKLVPVLLMLGVVAIWLSLSSSSIGAIGLPFVVTMIVFLMRFFPTLGQGVALVMKIASEARSGKDITAIIERTAVSDALAAEPIGRIDEIEFSDVSFRYPVSPEKPILEHARLRFERGKSYAIVGKSGIGKSTLIDLLLKFYVPDAGSIHINGRDIAGLSATALRQGIVLISQESAIFNDTVMNNVCLGLEATSQAVEDACRQAGIHDGGSISGFDYAGGHARWLPDQAPLPRREPVRRPEATYRHRAGPVAPAAGVDPRRKHQCTGQEHPAMGLGQPASRIFRQDADLRNARSRDCGQGGHRR